MASYIYVCSSSTAMYMVNYCKIYIYSTLYEAEDIDLVFTGLNIKTGPFTSEEYAKAKKSIREGKRCGEDKIRPKILKWCKIDIFILNFCNTAFIKNVSPEHWSVSSLVPIPKAGDLSKGMSYCRIALGSIGLKTYYRMILNRIRPEINCKLRINHNGFRKGRNAISQILALRTIIEGAKELNLKAIITSLIFLKNFTLSLVVKCLKSFIHMVSLNNLSVPSRTCTATDRLKF